MEVTDYRPAWREMFLCESMLLRSVLGGAITALHHIGSTSIEGMPAKPTVDILGVSPEAGEAAGRAEEMAYIGYEYMGEYGLSGRAFFTKAAFFREADCYVPLFNLHIYGISSAADILRYIAFRDYLSANSERAGEYAALKRRLARQFPWDAEAYVEGKERLVRSIEKDALEWSIARGLDVRQYFSN